MPSSNNFPKIFFLPSFLGLCVWLFALLILILQPIKVLVSFEAYVVFFYTMVSFALVFAITNTLVKNVKIYDLSNISTFSKLNYVFFWISNIIGFFGLYEYIVDFSNHLDGDGFFYVFIFDPLRIRGLAAEETSIGFQLSYFTWISFVYCVALLSANIKISTSTRFFYFILAFLCVFSNLLFVDRTRPVLLFIMGVFVYFIFRFNKIKHPLRILGAAFLGPVLIFIALAIFTQKFDSKDGVINNFLYYFLGGFGYFSAILNEPLVYPGLSNTLNPLYKFASAFSLTSSPPSQILEFKSIPFLTNVGTFLQPIYVDGGWPLVVLLTPILIGFLDFIALSALSTGTIIGLVVWSSVIAGNLLSFFVPKYNSTYFYLFVFLLFVQSAFAFIKLNLLVPFERRHTHVNK